jgi:hypothetical protein
MLGLPNFGDEAENMTGNLIEQPDASKRGRPPYNRLSIITLATYGEARLLLGADAMTTSWRELTKTSAYSKPATPDYRAQAIKIPHHGANDGLPLELASVFLREGAVLVISSSGHGFVSPSGELLNGLTEKGYAPFCTGRSAWCPATIVGKSCFGLIHLILTKEGEKVETEKPERARYPGMCQGVKPAFFLKRS